MQPSNLHQNYHYCREYAMKREGEYPTPVCPSVVALDQVHDLDLHVVVRLRKCTQYV